MTLKRAFFDIGCGIGHELSPIHIENQKKLGFYSS